MKITEEQKERANYVNLPQFLMAHGFDLKRVGKEYVWKEHDSLHIRDNGLGERGQWFRFSEHKGGDNIGFLREYMGMNFVDAVEALTGEHIDRTYTPSHSYEHKPQTVSAREFSLAEADNCRRVFAYLCKTRGLDYDMLSALVKLGVISQEEKTGNVLFKYYDDKGKIIGAEKVGTSTEHKFKGILTGSADGHGFEVVRGTGEKAFFFESAIDMLSYLQMHDKELTDCRLVSMMGVKPNIVLDTMLRHNIQPENVFLCSDNDTAGNEFARRLMEQYPDMKRISTPDTYKDWNDMLRGIPKAVEHETDIKEADNKNMLYYGNEMWNKATDNRDKSLVTVSINDYPKLQEQLENAGINYYGYARDNSVVMAINDKDIEWFKRIAGTPDLEPYKSGKPYSPPEKNIIGNAEYRYIPNKEYLSADRDLILKMAEIMDKQGIQFSGRLYPSGKGTLTVSHADLYTVRNIRDSVVNMRKQFANQEHGEPVGNREYRANRDTHYYMSKLNPEQFKEVKPFLETSANYHAVVRDGKVAFAVDKDNAPAFHRALENAVRETNMLRSMADLGLKMEQNVALSPVVHRLAVEDMKLNLADFFDKRYDDAQFGEMLSLVNAYIAQAPAERYGENSKLTDMLEAKSNFDRSIELSDFFSGHDFSDEQRAAITAMFVGDVTRGQIDSIDETFTAEDIQAYDEILHNALQESDVADFLTAHKQAVIDRENASRVPSEEEVLFPKADLAKFIAEHTPSSDEWEDMAYPLFERGYLDNHKPNDRAAFGYHMSEPEFYDLAHRYHQGDDIRRDLALGLLEGGNSSDIEFVFEQGEMSDRTYYYAENLRHSLHLERTEDGYNCSFNGMNRFVSFEEIGQAFIDRIHEEFDDLAFWWVRDDLYEAIPDITDEKITDLITAFDGAAMHGWENGDNQPKLNRIKKALHDILGDEAQTEQVFAIIAKEKYHVSFEAEQPEKQPDSLLFHFGKGDGDKWVSESDIVYDFAQAHPDCSLALGNAVMEYLDDKQHQERMIPDLKAGYYKKTDFSITAVIDGEDFNYDGRFDIGDGKGTGGGSLIDHIRTYNEGILGYTQYPFNQPEYKERAQRMLDIFIPFLEAHSELTAEEQRIFEDFKEQNPIRTLDDAEKTPAKYHIYQLPDGDKYHGIRFESMEQLKREGVQLNLEDYQLVYEDTLDDFKGNDTLESLFTKFNIDHPEDFRGHSLSVSDVIVISIDGKDTAYFCDSYGFVEMPEFFLEKEKVHEKSAKVSDLAVGDVIMYDGSRREVEKISDKSISLKDLDAPDYGGILLSTSDVLAYDGWQQDMEEKGFEILSKASQTAEIENQEKVEMSPLEKAKNLINDFCVGEYNDEADFSDLHNIGLAYTTLTDDELPVQITADLVDFKITYEFDGEVYSTEQYDSIEDMIDNGLTGLDFSDLVSVPDEVIERHTAKEEQTVTLMSDASEVQDIPSPADDVQAITLKYKGDAESLAEIKDKALSLGATVLIDNAGGEISIDTYEAHKSELDSLAYTLGLLTITEYTSAIDKPLFTDEDVIADIQRDENADVPFWEMPEVQGEQLTLFGDPEPIQQRKTEKPKPEFASGPVVDGVQVYEALAAEIDRGTGFVHGKFRVQDFYEKSRSQPNHPTTKELADFLKKEYGTGGHSGEGKISLVSYDSKGIDFSFENGEKFRHTWFNMAAMVEQRLRENTYLSENEKEKWQAIKAERSAEENSEPYKVEIGDRFRHKATGVVSEVISLTGALPYYEDECTVKRLSGAFEITENLSQDYLLKSGLYEYIGKAEPEKEQPAPEKPDITEETKVSGKAKTETGETKTSDTLPVVKNLSQLRKTIKPGMMFEITDHLRPDCIGERRIVTGVNSVDFTSRTLDENGEPTGKDRHMDFDKAKNWSFDGSEMTARLDNGDMLMSFHFIDSLEREQPEAEVQADIAEPSISTANADPVEKAPSVETDKDDNFTIKDDNLGDGGAKTKFRANVEAIRTLKAVETEKRPATAEEKETLSKYFGWGALAKAFDKNDEKWAAEYKELAELLTPEEYRQARASVNDAFYTSPTVIDGIYEALGNFGFDGGNVLEPAMGIGNFFGRMPEDMQKHSQLYGVEIDSLSGRIAQALYPDAEVSIRGFEQNTYQNGCFDVAVGNVPFGELGFVDSVHGTTKLHDYFFAETLDKVKDGGIVAFVTSAGTLDKRDEATRQMLADKADFIGAVRLPGGKNGAFRDNAGTEVTTDIIFLQKHEGKSVSEMLDTPDWVHIGETADGLPINKYFEQHPDMVLGTVIEGNKLYGSGTMVVAEDGFDLKTAIHEAIGKLSAEINHDKGRDVYAKTAQGEQVQIPSNLRNYSFFISDDQIFFKKNNTACEFRFDKTTAQHKRFKAFIELRDLTRELIEAQELDKPDSVIKDLQAKLNEVYDDFYKKYGLIHSQTNKRYFSEDVSYNLVAGLEKSYDKTELKEKSDIFTKRTIMPPKAVDHVETAIEALTLSVAEKARVDFEYMSRLTGLSEDELKHDLTGEIFKVPHTENGYQTASEYLSGDIRKKLREAEEVAEYDADFNINVSALKKAMPEPLKAGDIDIKIGAAWLDPKYYEQFMYELLQTPAYQRSDSPSARWNKSALITIEYSALANSFHISNKNSDRSVLATQKYGSHKMNAYDILEHIMNLQEPKIYKTVEVPDGLGDTKEKRVVDIDATRVVQRKADDIRKAFKSWIFRDADRREAIVQRYNELFNSIRPREFDGSALAFPMMTTDIKLHDHQKNAIAHAMFGGNTLFAHCVGAGKTYEMIAAAMESKRLGLCTKSLFAVPNHLTEQIGDDFQKLYPGANILVATKKDFQKANRQQLFAKIATGNYDAVIIGHSQLGMIPVSKERQVMTIQAQIDDILRGIEELKKSEGSKFQIKAMERSRKSLQKQLDKLQKVNQDNTLTFEQLGVDRLFIDEAHEFKNLFVSTKLQNVAGISNSASQKALDLFLKCRYLDEKTDGKGVIFATGTPLSNSITELHTMMRYLEYDFLSDHGLQHFDNWVAVFGEQKTDWELKPAGNGFKERTRIANYTGLPELMSMFKQVADIRTADTLKLDVPDCDYQVVNVDATPFQQELVQELSDRADAINSGNVDPSIDNMLKITSDGRKLGLDPRLIDPLFEDNPETKLNKCVENVARIHVETAEDKLTQIIFCDLGVPHKSSAETTVDGEDADDAKDKKSIAEVESLEEECDFCVYDDIRDKLIAKGIPAEEIAYIHDAKTEKQKSDLFDKVRSGEIRVLLGSTAKMGTGTNVQKKLIAVHDLDIPWRPADLEQRAGRIIRQGNENKKVQIFRYVTKGTFDAYSYQTLENKQRFISQIMTSKTPARKCEDVDQQALTYSEIKALCTGDERVKEKLMLENDVKELRVLAAEHKNTVYEMEDKIKDFPEKEKRLMAILDNLHTDREALRKLPIDPETKRPVFSITIGETVYTDKTEAGKVLNEALCNIKYADTPTKIGSFQGFELSATLNSSMNGGGLTACLKGAASHTAKLNVQNIPRIESALYNIDGRIENVRESLAKLRLDYAEAQKITAEPFPQQTELESKEERLATLTAELNQAAIEAKKNAPKREQTCYFERAKMRKEAKRVAMQKPKAPKDKAKNKHQGLE